MLDMFDLYFDLSKISNPTKEELKRAYDRLPDDEKVFSQYKHGKCVNYHNDPEIRNAYMREYHKMYRAEMETSEQRERRRQAIKLSDAKRHKANYVPHPKVLKMDAGNIKRREKYRMERESISC